jgi:hypothetical protein
MNKLFAVAAILAACLGCASSSYSHGRDFDEKQVAKIEKGKTTATEVKTIFGEPFMKNVVSANEEKWMYVYMRGTAHAKGGFFTPVTATSEGTNKTLDILMKDGVVTNFAYSEGPQTTTYGGAAPTPSSGPAPAAPEQK